jgi:phospholipid-binding lipoprotein MlaA
MTAEKWLLVPMLLAGWLMGGCASPTGDRSAQPGDADEMKSAVRLSPGRLPFPSSRRTALVTSSTTTTATVVSYDDYRDPLIWLNRGFFAFNDVTYRFLFIPVAKGYTWLVPDPVERCVGNFFNNLKAPIYVVNHLLQWKPKPLGRDLARFGINTTVGVLGLFDPAQSWFDIKEEETHFEDTLAHYGAGYGVYLVLPIFGPSDLRKAPSTVVDYFLNPVPYFVEKPASTAISAYDAFQDFAPSAEDYNTLRKKTEDPYIFYRNLYLQGVQRDADYQDR